MSDGELDSLLQTNHQEALRDIERNAAMMDAHLLEADRVIANLAAVEAIRSEDKLLELVEKLSENPT